MSWDEIHHIQERAVKRGMARRKEESIEYIGVDEKNFRKGHSYVTVTYDLTRSRVLDVAEERKEESLKEIFNKMTETQKASVKAVAADMWEPFANAIKECLPSADIVHDKYHIVSYLGEGVNKVRKSENRELIKAGSETLKGTKFLWLTKPDNMKDDQKKQFKALVNEELKVSRAWAIKELFSKFWSYSYEKSARTFFSNWYWWATHSRLKPMIDVAKMLNRHLENILTYLKHHICNAIAEGFNSKIQQVKSVAKGFRNFANYRIAILFYCGKLELLP